VAFDDGDDLMLVLAKRIVYGSEATS